MLCNIAIGVYYMCAHFIAHDDAHSSTDSCAQSSAH
jgi:hypothetical protein